jgi:low affinity Fe/Cu permease
MPEIVCDVLIGLKNNKVIITKPKSKKEDDKYNEFITRFAKTYSSPIWGAIAFAGVLLFMVFAAIPEHRLFTGWQTSNNVVFAYHEVFWFLIFLVGAMAIVKTILAIYWFNKLFREFQADVRVLHPDGAGGLSPLGNFSVKIGYMIGLLGFLVTIVIWTQSTYLLSNRTFSFNANPAIISLAFAYLVLAPIVFFAPIGSAHSAMRKAKNDFIIAISDQFENDFEKLQSLLNKNGAELKEALEKIEHLQKIHSMVTRFPIWPFNTASLVRFFSSVFSPIILSLLPSLIIELLFTK